MESACRLPGHPQPGGGSGGCAPSAQLGPFPVQRHRPDLPAASGADPGITTVRVLISAQWIRVGVALFYFALPGTSRSTSTSPMPNGTWLLPPSSCFWPVLQVTHAGEVFDSVIVVLAGLTGRFAFVLLPIAVAVALIRCGSRS